MSKKVPTICIGGPNFRYDPNLDRCTNFPPLDLRAVPPATSSLSTVNWTGSNPYFANSGSVPTSIPTGHSFRQLSIFSVASGVHSSHDSIGLASSYNGTSVLGTAGQRGKSENSGFAQGTSSNSIITYINCEAGKCWGSNGLHGKKVLTLANTDSTDVDMEQLGYTLRAFNFSLDAMLLQGNKIGDFGVACWINGITSQSFQTLYNPDTGYTRYVSPTLKVTQSVVFINFADNSIGDPGAKTIADALASGKLSSLQALDVSGNQITKTGQGYFARALDEINQSIAIIFTKVQEVSKQAFKQTIKSMLYIAKQNGISTKEMLTTDETIEHCKKGTFNVAKNIIGGYFKCTTKIGKIVSINELTLQDVGIDIISIASGSHVIKGVFNFTCVSKETIFSVVDEDFSNCLVGVDSLLDQ